MSYSFIPPAGRTLALVVRHGRTNMNEDHPRVRGWDNPSLNEDGRLDAQLAGNALKKYEPQIIYSSDLVRDSETAGIISEILGNLGRELAFELRTADMGEWTGQPDPDVADQVRKWYERSWTNAPSGESYDKFCARFFPWIDAKLQLAREVPQFRPMIFTSHGRNSAALDVRYNFKSPIDGKMSLHGGIAEIKEMPSGRIDYSFLGPTEDLIADK